MRLELKDIQRENQELREKIKELNEALKILKDEPDEIQRDN